MELNCVLCTHKNWHFTNYFDLENILAKIIEIKYLLHKINLLALFCFHATEHRSISQQLFIQFYH